MQIRGLIIIIPAPPFHVTVDNVAHTCLKKIYKYN
ncbi:unnamed protein product [Brugia timori]|uniref:Bm1198, isoform a n=2 Tax=Brugia TaxID=6278 RepID=A0A1I9G6I7_BRUMA|nr:Bm1198, isoform a [Brugia malayi]VDO17431.1 unnamed protein product [Brugia timori]